MLISSCLIVSVFGIFPEKISAEEYIERTGIVIGGWAGYGLMDVNTDDSSGSSHGTFALGLKGGYAITSKFITGLELNGWTLKAYNNKDPSKGETVSNVSIFINYFPFKYLPIYFAGGGGQLSYTNNSPSVNGRDKGGSWFVGSGYEYKISNKLLLVPQIRYSQGNFTGGNFNVYEIAVGMNWYSGSYK
jgi:hypothetical protein